MASRPPLLFDVSNFLLSHKVAQLNFSQIGLYISMLCLCWESPGCGIPDKKTQVRKLLGRQFRKRDWEKVVEVCFVPHPELPNKITNMRIYGDFVAENEKSCQRVAKGLPKLGKAAKTQKKATDMAYLGNDRSGNPRKPLAGYVNLWMSEAEMERCLKEFKAAGLKETYHHIAFRVVDDWFTEKPHMLAQSVEHKSRICAWGLQRALDFQSTAEKAKVAGKGKLNNLEKAREVLYGDDGGSNSTNGVHRSGVRQLPGNDRKEIDMGQPTVPLFQGWTEKGS